MNFTDWRTRGNPAHGVGAMQASPVRPQAGIHGRSKLRPYGKKPKTKHPVYSLKVHNTL